MVSIIIRYFLHHLMMTLSILILLEVSLFPDNHKNGVMVYGAEVFNTQVMYRVQERLNDFMKLPIDVCNRLNTFRNLHLFPNDMNSIDRDIIMKFLYVEAPATIVYLGLEDGTFYYYWEDFITFEYREPGNSGYNVQNINANEFRNNYKHWISCLNTTTGQSDFCKMNVDMTYISCINDCELIPCPTSSSSQQQEQSQINNNNHTNTNNDQIIKWCPNYEIKTVQEGDELGYIPVTEFCINTIGQTEQRVGYVLKDYETKELGNCYYNDMETYSDILVNRTLKGNYAYCGGGDAVCDTTFKGGFMTSEYDPRYRDWYIDTKKYQKSIWTDPYTFSNENSMGITYTQPIYTTIIDNNTATNKTIFKGVLAVDYYLHQINDFLIEQYSGLDLMVLVIEQKEPNYLIAASTNGTKVTQLVLIKNETQICPDEKRYDTELCTVVRVPISSLQYSTNEFEVVLYRAFLAQYNANFPKTQSIHFKINDDIDSHAYVSQGQLYSQENSDNLNWHIFVIFPMDKSSTDAATINDSTKSYVIITCFLGSLGFIGCFTLLIIFVRKRHERAIIHADWRFTSAFILGCTILNMSTFTLIGENTNFNCMIRMWSFNGLFVAALSPLFVKVWRMYKLLHASAGFHRVSVNNFQAFLYTLPMIMIEIIILTLFTFIDPPKQTEQLGVGEGIGVQQVTCEQDTNLFFITQLAFDACLVFAGCVLAYITRDLDPKFGEAKQLGFSMYNIAFTGIVMVAIVKLVDFDQVSQIVLQAVGVLWASFFCSFSFVLPRLLEVKKDRKDKKSGKNSRASLSFQPTASGFHQVLTPANALSQFRSSSIAYDDDDDANDAQFALSTSGDNNANTPDLPSKLTSSTQSIEIGQHSAELGLSLDRLRIVKFDLGCDNDPSESESPNCNLQLTLPSTET